MSGCVKIVTLTIKTKRIFEGLRGSEIFEGLLIFNKQFNVTSILQLICCVKWIMIFADISL